MIEYDTKAWYSIVFQMRGSVMPRLVPRVVLVAAAGAAAVLIYERSASRLPPPTLIGAALGLLLVFRTNASYDRYWEGRKKLGMVVNRSRDLARQIASYVTSAEDRSELQRQIVAMAALINQMLRKQRDLSLLGELLTERERELLADAAPRPAMAAQWISARLARLADAGRLSELRLQLMDANLTQLIDELGGAERIMKTPVPFAYAQHIKMFTVVFCFTVPLVMVDTLGWYTPLAAAMLAFALSDRRNRRNRGAVRR
jgi:putative membrane protein